MLKLTVSILSISLGAMMMMMMCWGGGHSNNNDNDPATTLQRHLSSLQQFMDPKSTNLRSDVVGGVIPPASVYIDQDGVCVNALPYAKMHHKDPKEVESYQTHHIQRAGGDVLSYGEIEPPELKTLPSGSSFALWNCERRSDCDLHPNLGSASTNIKGSAWTADGKDAFSDQNLYTDTDPRTIWIQHDKYEFPTEDTSHDGSAVSVFQRR